MGAVREYNFTSGPETPTLPTSPTPTAADDLVTKGYADSTYALAGAVGGTVDIEIVRDGDNPPTELEAFDLYGLVFPTGADTDVRFTVPLAGYTPGNQIKLIIKGYGTATGNFVMETVSSLYEPGSTDAGIAPTNQRTNNIVAISVVINQFLSNGLLELTDVSGQINAVPLASDDILTVNLRRNGTNVSDTLVGDFVLTKLIVDLNG